MKVSTRQRSRPSCGRRRWCVLAQPPSHEAIPDPLFLVQHTQTTLPDTTIDALYAKFSESKQDSNGAPIRLMTTDGFTSFLMSSDNMAFSERQLKVCDDMTRPLCEYYISSSHNVSTSLRRISLVSGWTRISTRT